MGSLSGAKIGKTAARESLVEDKQTEFKRSEVCTDQIHSYVYMSVRPQSVCIKKICLVIDTAAQAGWKWHEGSQQGSNIKYLLAFYRLQIEKYQKSMITVRVVKQGG